MIVGFTITDFKGHEKDAEKFIRKVCLLEDQSIAKNIVDAGVGVNIYSADLDVAELFDQPFSSEVIETIEGKIFVVSVVNFTVELLYKGEIIRIRPTEYLHVDPSDMRAFELPIKLGVFDILPRKIPAPKGRWILRKGKWNDTGVWVDTDYWKDA